MAIWTFVFLLVWCVPRTASQQWDLEPLTSAGSLKGNLVVTKYGEVMQYLGIRYGQPPERFSLPKAFELPDQSRVVDADKFGPTCYQPRHLDEVRYQQLSGLEGNASESEDCLFLNVFVATAPVSYKRAIMVWLPASDASQIDGTMLAVRGDVIVVSVNYRVGVFGFLSTGNSTVPGNQGIWDVVEALKWVRRNANAFGGDASQITLFGHFTGSMVASLLLVSQKLTPQDTAGQPLVSRMILQSGVASGSFINTNPANQTSALASLAGCTGSHLQIIQCLRLLNAEELSKLSRSISGWMPVVDGILVSSDPLRSVRKAVYNRNISVIIGETSGEGSLCILRHDCQDTLYRNQLLANNITRKDFGQMVKELVSDHLKVQDSPVIDATVHEYRVWSDTGKSYTQQLIRLCGILYIRVKNEQFARALSKRGSNVWRYEFAHRPSFSNSPPFLGAAHGDDVLFVFVLLDEDTTNSKEKALAEQVLTAWTNFAKTGDPNGGDAARSWPQFLDSNRQMRVFSTSEEIIKSTDFLSRDVDFWSSVVTSMLRNLQRGAMQGRTSCSRQKSSSNSLYCSTSCPAVIGMLVLCLLLSFALLSMGYFFFRLIQRGNKGLLANEQISQ